METNGYFTWRQTGTLREDQYTFLITYRSILLSMRNVSEKSCRVNFAQEIKTRFIFNFFFENHAVYGIMGEKIAGPDRPQMTIWRTYTLRICNSYCFSTATIVARTRCNVTLQSNACLVNISNPLHKKTVKISNWYDIHRTEANSFLCYLVHIKKHVDLPPYLAVRI